MTNEGWAFAALHLALVRGAPRSGATAGAWAARFRRLARDDERLEDTVAGPRFLAFAGLLHRLVKLLAACP